MRGLLGLLFGFFVDKPVSKKPAKDNADYSREELMSVLKRLYRCRDLEISNLWQRSVFLSVFMVLCFTGYGYLITKIIDSMPSVCDCLDKFQYLNIAAVALGCLSMIFSLLWICMAKSSKAWYEVYEGAISGFEDKYQKELKMPEDNIMGRMNLDPKDINSCIFSLKAGAYSPSKINIAIGQVCLSVWFLVTVGHLVILSSNSIITGLIATVIFLVVIIVMMGLICSKWIKSGFLGQG